MRKALYEFDEHVAECGECYGGLLKSLCNVGIELILEVDEDDLPAEWHPVVRMLLEQEQLEKEANANFEFYKNCEEP